MRQNIENEKQFWKWYFNYAENPVDKPQTDNTQTTETNKTTRKKSGKT